VIWDVIIVGGGAAGLFCAGIAGQLGKKVLVLDHAEVLCEKIRISGGGRCNFTNLYSAPQHFLSLNPHFVKSPLARYSSQDFIHLVQQYRIPFHEKHQGQLFCDDSAKDVIQMLMAECQRGGVRIEHPVSVERITKSGDQWALETSQGGQITKHLVIATGGLPVPAIGATEYALDLARQFDIPVTAVRPALVPLSFTSTDFADLADLSGISLPVSIQAGHSGQRQRLAKQIAERFAMSKRNWAEVSKADRQSLKEYLIHWSVKPAGTLGWKKAEVMVGGIDTKALDGKTMMSKAHPNLFFIGECVDVTGHLGGHNFQWAWSSAYVCAQAIAAGVR